MNEILQKSCEDLADLIDGSVALTVTSPPYWNAIDYDRHADDSTQHYRTRNYKVGFDGYDAYLAWLLRIFGGILQKTKPGGFCSIVIGTVLFDGRHYSAPQDLTYLLTRAGWDFHQDIVWNKVTGGVKRAGVFIQKPYPGYFYPNIMTEYILIFKKPGPATYSGRTQDEKERARVPINKLFTQDIANTVWHIAPVPPGHLNHPCPFPEEIPHRLIRLFSYNDDLILDPFAGSGQTLKVARHLGRRFVGYEIIEKYVKLAGDRIKEPLSIRPEQLAPKFEKIPIDEPLGGSGRNGKTRHGAGLAVTGPNKSDEDLQNTLLFLSQ